MIVVVFLGLTAENLQLLSLDKGKKSFMRNLVLVIFIITSFTGAAQFPSDDTIKLFHLRNINVTSTTANINAKNPAYSGLSNNFSRNNILQSFDDFTFDESKPFSSRYSGFKINFLFESSILNQTKLSDFFTFAFETGNQSIDLFRLIKNDGSLLDYTIKNEAFRLTFGARKVLTRKNRRFRFFTGLDWIHEVHISSFLFEGDRRIFAEKKYSTYFNIPIGVEWRFLGKKHDYEKYKSLFFALHFGAGLQNIDPYNLFGPYTGTSFGLSFTI